MEGTIDSKFLNDVNKTSFGSEKLTFSSKTPSSCNLSLCNLFPNDCGSDDENSNEYILRTNINDHMKTGAVPKHYNMSEFKFNSNSKKCNNVPHSFVNKGQRYEKNKSGRSRCPKNSSKLHYSADSVDNDRKNSFFFEFPQNRNMIESLPAGGYLLIPVKCISNISKIIPYGNNWKENGKCDSKNSGVDSNGKIGNDTPNLENSESVGVAQEERPKTIVTSAMTTKNGALPPTIRKNPGQTVLKCSAKSSTKKDENVKKFNVTDCKMDEEPTNSNNTKSEIDGLSHQPATTMKREITKLNFLESLQLIVPGNDYNNLTQLWDAFNGNEDDILKYIHSELEACEKHPCVSDVLDVIPDIDPIFVQEMLEKLPQGDVQEFNTMVEFLVDSNYPKSKEFDPKFKNKKKLWDFYITNFDVAKYLEKVPDPEGTFFGVYLDTNKNTVNNHRNATETFLRSRYPHLANDVIDHVFKRRKNSTLVTICHDLDSNYNFAPINCDHVDSGLCDENFDERFLQEVSFIINRVNILDHIRQVNEKKDFETAVAIEENSFLECLICYDPEVVPSEVVQCPDGHICCRSCVRGYVEIAFGNGKCRFSCMLNDCEMEYGSKTLEKVLRNSLFNKVMAIRAAEDVAQASINGLEKCTACEYAYIPSPDDKIFKCENEDCRLEICRLCKYPSHIPLSCKEVEGSRQLNMRKKVEEAMSNELIRSCPNCGKKFIKEEGCNRMTCPSCNVTSCYVCRNIVYNYDHFSTVRKSIKCPLYSDTRELHEVRVAQAGAKTLENLAVDPDISPNN